MEHMGAGKQTTPHPLDLPIRGKIPVVSGVSNVYHTTRLCERLFQPKSDFDLTDPNGYLLSSGYSSLHDPNLRKYLHRKDIHQRLLNLGFITKDEKIMCSVKELNRYRDHLADVELDWRRRFRTEQKESVRKFLTLQQQGQIPEHVTLSDVTEWLLHRGRSLFSKRQQSNRARRFPSRYGLEEDCYLARLSSIAMGGNMVDLDCCPSLTCRSELLWNAKGRALLQEVSKEVKREMRLEQRWVTNQQEKEKMKRERQQKRRLKGQKKERHSPTKTDSQDNPESMENILISVSNPDNTQFDPSDHQSLPSPVEQKCDLTRKLSALCQNMVEAVNQKAIISTHNLCAEGPGLVDSVSSTLVTCSSLIGQAGFLQSITQQLSEIEQRLLKEHFKGTITTEDLHTIIHSVVVTVVEEVNGILIPAIMAFEYERLTGSVSSSDIPSSDVPTYSSPSSSDYYQTSSFSTSLQSSSPQIGLSSNTPTPPIMPFKPTTGVIRQGTLTVSFPEEADRESERETEGEASLSVDLAAYSSPSPSENQSSPLETSPPCLGSSGTSFESAGTRLESSGSSLGALGTNLLVKVEAVIQEVIRGAVDKLEAERNNRHGIRVRNMSPEEKAESVSKSTEAASRESSGERRVRGVGNNGKKVETVGDRVAKTEVSTIADTTAKTELLTIEDTMAKLEIKKVEIIADVIPKTASEEVATVVDAMEKVEAKEEDTLADEMARTEFTEVPIIAAKNEVQEVETIADVTEKTKIKEVVEINKRDTQDAKVKASFETEVKLTKRLDIDAKTEEANAKMNADEQANTISEYNIRCYELILTAGESKIEVRDEKIECKVELRDENIDAKNETMDAKDSVENAHAEKSEHSHVSPELFQSSSDSDEGGPSIFPMSSMLKSAALSSDQVDEILDKVIDVLTGEGHKVIFSEDRPSMTSSPDSTVCIASSPESRPGLTSTPVGIARSSSIPEARPSSSSATPGSSPSSESLCCMSSGHDQEIHVQCPSDPPGKLLGGQASTLRSQNPLLLNEKDLSDRELMPYANSIINIIMQKMHHDDDLYESVGGQKPLSPRRRSRPALLSQYSPLDNAKIPVLYIPKRADRKSLKSVDPKALRVVRWVLQTIHRRHGWLGQANDHSRQAKESLLLCDVIQVLLEKLDHKMATTGDLQVAPTQTYALHTDDRFKTKLQEATVEPISDIIGHLSINLLRSESCFEPKKRWSSSSTLAKSVSMTNLGSRAVASAVAMDISSNVVEKLKEASGSSKTTCSMTNLRDFVRAMTVSHPELSQQVTSGGSKIHNVYREVLEMVVTKLRSFVTKGGSFHKPTEHLAQKLAESCLEVECAFMEILQTLKSHGTGDEACSAWAVDCMSTTISDTMFKRVTEGGHPPHVTHVSGATVTNCGPIRISDVNQQRPIKIKARMSRSSVNLLQTTVEKFVHKLTDERVSIPELGEGMSTSTSPQQGKDRENLRRPQSVQRRFTTEPPSELSPRSQLKREELISMLCALMSKSIISSLSLDRAFQVPVDTVSDTKESRASAVKLGTNARTLVPTPPPRPTNSQRDNKPVQEDSRRRIRPLRTLQAAKRVVSSMDLDISRTTSRSTGMVAQLACPVNSNNNLFSEPSSTSAAISNTSLAASEITENLVCKLLQGDSPDFMSSSNHTSPRP